VCCGPWAGREGQLFRSIVSANIGSLGTTSISKYGIFNLLVVGNPTPEHPELPEYGGLDTTNTQFFVLNRVVKLGGCSIIPVRSSRF
jgi:hypothetical protein